MFRKLQPLVTLAIFLGCQTILAAAQLYVPGQLIVSLHTPLHVLQLERDNDLIQTNNSELNAVLSQCQVYDIQPLILNYSPDRHQKSDCDLSQIYLFYFPAELDVQYCTEHFNRLSVVDYAEPDFLLPLMETPNDPYFPDQWHLQHIQCEAAWDAFEDNSETVIAIIDSGVEWFHPDLTDNIWVNPGEDLDGDGVVYETEEMPGEEDEYDQIDNDNNNYVDDFIGWDFVVYAGDNCDDNEDCFGQDNDPHDFSGHGTHCTGIASAVTDNNIGIASVPWNAKIMGLRAGFQAANGSGYVITSAAVNAVYYAVVNGAHIISMSFGGGSGNTLQTACTYAWSNGLLCFHAGSGQGPDCDGVDNALGMISVAATDSSDNLTPFSGWGDWLDIAAPAVDILSTLPGFQGSYGYRDGISSACPLAASVAAYIWALNPEFDNAEVRYHLLHTTDYIDDLNPDYEGQLGTGRINAYKAAYGIFTTELDMGEIVLTDDVPGGNGDLRLLPGETAGVWAELVNSWINPAYNPSITLSTDDSDITIPEPVFPFGNINPHCNADNESNPILFDISPSAQPHHSQLTLSYRSDFSDSASYEIPVMIEACDIEEVPNIVAAPRGCPDAITLSQNHPNPFNPSTTIEFSLPHSQEIQLVVYNVIGERVATLAEGMYAAGMHRVTFDTNVGENLMFAHVSCSLPSGVYMYRLVTEEQIITRKMLLVR